jgi:hypothetical protein
MRQINYPGRLGGLGSLFVLLAVLVTIALAAWIFLWHAVNHAITQEGVSTAGIRFFTYIAMVFVFDYAMLKAAKLVSIPKERFRNYP